MDAVNGAQATWQCLYTNFTPEIWEEFHLSHTKQWLYKMQNLYKCYVLHHFLSGLHLL